MTISNRQPYLDRLRDIGRQDDQKLDPAHSLVLLASRNHPGISVTRFHHHLTTLAADTGQIYDALRNNTKNAQTDSAEATLDLRRRSLQKTFMERHDYTEDPDKSNIENLDMMRVIDRRRGLSQTLAALALHAVRKLGWTAQLLALPSHFVLRLEQGSARLICDPAANFASLEAVDLRQIVKRIMGPNAELSADYYAPLSNREIIIRIQNYRKLRLIEQEEYKNALKTVMDLQLIAPGEHRLLLDEGVLRAKTGDKDNAVKALRHYIDATPDYREKRDAQLLIQQILDSARF